MPNESEPHCVEDHEDPNRITMSMSNKMSRRSSGQPSDNRARIFARKHLDE